MVDLEGYVKAISCYLFSGAIRPRAESIVAGRAA